MAEVRPHLGSLSFIFPTQLEALKKLHRFKVWKKHCHHSGSNKGSFLHMYVKTALHMHLFLLFPLLLSLSKGMNRKTGKQYWKKGTFLILLLCLPKANEKYKKCTKYFKAMINDLIAKASLKLNSFSHLPTVPPQKTCLSMLGWLCCYVLWELEDSCGNQKVRV